MRGLAIAGALALFGLALFALPVAGAELTGGCTLDARSYATDGTTILDEGVAPGSEGSQSDPFDVAWDGTVDFHFTTGDKVLQNNEWEIYAAGVPVAILKGSDDNPMDRDETGFVNVGEGIPDGFRIVGLVHVSGWLEGNEGVDRCEGSGWVRIVGDPVGTIPWIVFLLLLAAGALFLVATPYTITWEEGGHSGEIPGGDPGRMGDRTAGSQAHRPRLETDE